MKELNTIGVKKWLANLGGATPTLDSGAGVMVGDRVVDTSTTPDRVWVCKDNTPDATAYILDNPALDTSSFSTLLSSAESTTQLALSVLDDHQHTVGMADTGLVADDGDGTITVASGTAYLYSAAGWSGSLRRYTLAGAGDSSVALTDNSVNYLIADYNGGSPRYAVTTNPADINSSSKALVANIYREGTTLHIIEVNWAKATSTRANDRLVQTQRFVRTSGLGLSESATRHIDVGLGVVYYGVRALSLPAVASDADSCDFYYHVGGNWTKGSITQYNNTQYDTGTALATLSNSNRYAVNWVYRYVEAAKHIAVILGSGDYDITQAKNSQPPAAPTVLQRQAVLVGRIIVAHSASSAYQVDSAFVTSYETSPVVDHNDLGGLQGGVSGDYQHLTTDQASAVLAFNNGFVSESDHSISVDETARTVTITPVPNVGNAGTFKVVSGGVMRTFTGTQTSNPWTAGTVGSKFIFFNSLGVLTTTEGTANAWTLQNGEAPVIYAYWNGSSCTIIQEEDHPNTWNQNEWLYHHQVFGARWISGLTIYANPITAIAPNSGGLNTCVALDGGTMADEAERSTVQNSNAGGNWQQILFPTPGAASTVTNTNCASMDVVYKNSSSAWVRTSTNAKFPFLWNSGNNRPQYVTSAGNITDVTDDNYFVYFIIMTSDYRTGKAVFLLPFPTLYTTLAAAQAGASISAMTATLGGLPASEVMACYRLIFNVNHTGGGQYDVAVKYTRLNEVLDLRPFSFAQLAAISTTPAAHASTHLSGGTDMIPLTDGIRVELDKYGSALSTGDHKDIVVRFNCVISSWTILNTHRVGDTDAVSVDVRKCTYAEYASNPYPSTSIVASEPLALTGGAYSATGSCVGWTTAVSAGDVLRFYVSSATALTNLSVLLNVARS